MAKKSNGRPKRPSHGVGTAVQVMKIATGESEEKPSNRFVLNFTYPEQDKESTK